jgi:hypothetical protein
MLEYVNEMESLHFAADLRLPRLRISGPANHRFVAVSPSRRRSLSRRSASLRNLHEQFVGIVQASKGRRGASRSKTRLPVACFAAAQHLMLGASETARKSPPVFDRLAIAIGVAFFTGCSRGFSPNSPLSTLIMMVNNLLCFPSAANFLRPFLVTAPVIEIIGDRAVTVVDSPRICRYGCRWFDSARF